jgi:type IV fimbrial biogenesis protein FimT
MAAPRSRLAGVTLIELMFAITVLAIIIGLGAPSFARLVRENRLVSLTNDLVSSFALARSEAARRGMPVSLCASADGAACTEDVDWAVGWVLFTDDTGTAGVIDADDEVLSVSPALPAGFTLEGVQPFIRFFPNGLTTPANDKTFQLQSDAQVELVRCMTVSGIGRVATVKEACP